MDKKEIGKLILAKWGVDSKKIKLIRDGCSTKNWLISGDKKEKYVFRNAGPYVDYVTFQCDLLIHLKQEQITYLVPEPIKTKSNSLTETYRGNSFFLYKYIPGKITRKANKIDGFDIGQMLARKHGTTHPIP